MFRREEIDILLQWCSARFMSMTWPAVTVSAMRSLPTDGE
jgi:hypothetical protein